VEANDSFDHGDPALNKQMSVTARCVHVEKRLAPSDVFRPISDVDDLGPIFISGLMAVA
jgi:hypothetical protein